MITIAVGAAWLIGIAVAAWAGEAWTAAAPLSAAVVGLLGFRARLPLAVCAAVACAGVALLATVRWQAAARPPGRGSIARLVDGGRVRLVGMVTTEPQDRGRSQTLTVRVEQADTGAGWRAAHDAVLVRITVGRAFRVGDVVELTGQVTAPPELEHFDYREYLARQGIRARMDYPAVRVTGYRAPSLPRRWLLAGRRALSRALDRALPQPEAALARGIIVGDRSAIPASLTDDFNRSGTSHLIAISGYNIALVAGMVLSALSGVAGRRLAALIALAAITAYSLFVGLSPSVARALVMGTLMIGASLLGRPGAAPVALLLAAVGMTAQEPRVIDDVGFQLSFGATAGIMLLAPIFQDAGRRLLADAEACGLVGGLVLTVWDGTAVTLAATAATLPVMLHSFGRLSLVAPLANLLLAPLFPVVMATAGLAGGVAAVAPPAAHAVGLLAWPPLALTIAIARWASRLPGAGLAPGYPGGGVTLALYVGGAVLSLLGRAWWQSRARADDRGAPMLRVPVMWTLALAPTALLLATAAGVMITRDRADGRLTVTYLDVAGAPVALVTGPGGERALIDSGVSSAALAGAIDALLPATRREVPLVIITRHAPTTMGGLQEAITRYGVHAVLARPAGPGEPPLPDVAARVAELPPGSRIDLGRQAWLEVEEDADDRSRLVVVAVMGGRRIAVTPGAEGDVTVMRGGAAGQIVVGPALVDGFSVREQGPVRVSTNGTSIRMSPARGTVAPGGAIDIRAVH